MLKPISPAEVAATAAPAAHDPRPPGPDWPLIEPQLAALLQVSGLQPLCWKGDVLLPVVQGGMGVGVSAHRLAGAVAAAGGVGTLSSVDLRRHHPDLM